MTTLPAYTSHGSYTIIYRTPRSEVLCPECATREGLPEESGHIHWEGEAHTCEECGHEMESSYGISSEVS